MFSWFESMGISSSVDAIRDNFSIFNDNLPAWIYYSLPDGSWVYALTSALLIIWNGKRNLWLLIPLASGPGIETLQLLQLFPGTFDILDLVLMCLGILLSLLLLKDKRDEKEHF